MTYPSAEMAVDCPGCVCAAECPKHGRLIPPGWYVDEGGRYCCDGDLLLCCWTYDVETAWKTYAENGAVSCSVGVGCVA